MVHVQNATLAGGVAVGAVADLMLSPAGALAVGAVAGILSVVGYSYLQVSTVNFLSVYIPAKKKDFVIVSNNFCDTDNRAYFLFRLQTYLLKKQSFFVAFSHFTLTIFFSNCNQIKIAV